MDKSEDKENVLLDMQDQQIVSKRRASIEDFDKFVKNSQEKQANDQKWTKVKRGKNAKRAKTLEDEAAELAGDPSDDAVSQSEETMEVEEEDDTTVQVKEISREQVKQALREIIKDSRMEKASTSAVNKKQENTSRNREIYMNLHGVLRKVIDIDISDLHNHRTERFEDGYKDEYLINKNKDESGISANINNRSLERR
ncbi:hypothetical protein RF55_9858 [Lasius niger]|uniref:Uncharacterized protein n=1 Tax=Lasius niger TaxID=67767 RepID=A0A0J7KIY4_LASNI|nr:hypothetical protein RF55_9858 [Lasius niger]